MGRPALPPASGWMRVGFVVGALGLLAYGLVSRWGETRDALAQLSVWSVVGATAAATGALGAMMLAWRTLLADLGSSLRVPEAARLMFLSQLGKYVPGAVWPVLAVVDLARDRQIPAKRTASATLIAMATTLACGLLVIAVTLPAASPDTARTYWWVLALAPALLLVLHPAIMTGGLNILLRLLRRPPAEHGVTLSAMARAGAWTLLGWFAFSIHAWLIVRPLAGDGHRSFLLAAGSYALGWAVGFLMVLAPGGVGVRELAIATALAPALSFPHGLIVAIVSRLATTLADLIWATVVLAVRPPPRSTKPEHPCAPIH